MLPLPKVITYGRYQNDNYGLNALKINTPGITRSEERRVGKECRL